MLVASSGGSLDKEHGRRKAWIFACLSSLLLANSSTLFLPLLYYFTEIHIQLWDSNMDRKLVAFQKLSRSSAPDDILSMDELM